MEQWGRLPATLSTPSNVRPRIWVHAVSAGEVVAAVPIVRELRLLLPNFEILLSVTTASGMEMAESQARPYADQLFYFPFDLPWIARRVVANIRPRVFVSLESEMWPNVLHELKRVGASTVMVNGRMTERSFRRAHRFAGGLFKWMLSNIDRLLVQSDADAARIAALGGVAAASRIHVLGNSKFDQDIPTLTDAEVGRLRAGLKLPPDAPVFVAGSTRSSEEDEVVLRAYLEMRSRVSPLCLLIAPRHIDRAGQVVDAMRRHGLDPVRKTEIESAASVRHLVLDTMGELAGVYAVAAFAFVGNSFDPVVKGGGQNLLQPLAHGKPVLFGPRTATIRSEVALVTQAAVGFQVRSAQELAAVGTRLLLDEAKRADIGRRARNLVVSQRGVSARYARSVADAAQAVAVTT